MQLMSRIRLSNHPLLDPGQDMCNARERAARRVICSECQRAGMCAGRQFARRSDSRWLGWRLSDATNGPGILGFRSEFLLDGQQSVEFCDALAPAAGTGLDVPGSSCHHEVSDEGVLGFSATMGNVTTITVIPGQLHAIEGFRDGLAFAPQKLAAVKKELNL